MGVDGSMKLSVKEHGNYFVEPEDVIICPECGCQLEKSNIDDKIESEWIFFDIFLKQQQKIHCVCPECHCKFEISKKSKIKDVDYDIILKAIPILLMIIGIILLLVSFCALSVWMGLIGVILFFISCAWMGNLT
jgi:hypothetical protein